MEGYGAAVRRLRSGFYGWMGLGGSVFQWNPSLRIGFAYTPTLMLWHDDACVKGAQLQEAVANCARKQAEEAEAAQVETMMAAAQAMPKDDKI